MRRGGQAEHTQGGPFSEQGIEGFLAGELIHHTLQRTEKGECQDTGWRTRWDRSSLASCCDESKRAVNHVREGFLGRASDRMVDAGELRSEPAPGRPGSSVMLGHVDSKHGPAVFYCLRNLKPANRVAVRLSDGMVAHFEVTRVVSYANEAFPADEV